MASATMNGHGYHQPSYVTQPTPGGGAVLDGRYPRPRSPTNTLFSQHTYSSLASSTTTYSTLFNSGLQNLNSPTHPRGPPSEFGGLSRRSSFERGVSGRARDFIKNLGPSRPPKDSSPLSSPSLAPPPSRDALRPPTSLVGSRPRDPSPARSGSGLHPESSLLFGNEQASRGRANSSSSRAPSIWDSNVGVGVASYTGVEGLARLERLPMPPGSKAAKLLGLDGGGSIALPQQMRSVATGMVHAPSSPDSLSPSISSRPPPPPRTTSLPSHGDRRPPPPPGAPLPSVPSQYASRPPPINTSSRTALRPPSWDGSATLGQIAMENMEQRASPSTSRFPSGVTDNRATPSYSTPLASPATFFSSPSQGSYAFPPPPPNLPPPYPTDSRPPPTSASNRVSRATTSVSGVSSASSGTRRYQRGNALDALEGRLPSSRPPPPPIPEQRPQIPVKALPTSGVAGSRASRPFLDWEDEEVYTHPFQSQSQPSRPPSPPPTYQFPIAEKRASVASMATIGSALDPYFTDAGAPAYHPYTQRSNSISSLNSRKDYRSSVASDAFSLAHSPVNLDAFPAPPSPAFSSTGRKTSISSSSFWKRNRKSSVTDSFLDM